MSPRRKQSHKLPLLSIIGSSANAGLPPVGVSQ
jgi:hypothetical protein